MVWFINGTVEAMPCTLVVSLNHNPLWVRILGFDFLEPVIGGDLDMSGHKVRQDCGMLVALVSPKAQ